MTEGPVPEHVLRFLSEHIGSVPQLEALLLLWREPLRLWSVADIASRIYVADEIATGVLQSLVQHRLIRQIGTGPPQYQFDSEWDRERRIMALVAETYQRHLIQIATFIHSRASASVREFARAFDFKKEP